MKNRHLIISELILIIVSVLFFSCGIPSAEDYVSMENFILSSTVTNTDINIQISRYSLDDIDPLSKIDKGPSLLLAYSINTSIDSTVIEGLKNALKTYVDNNKIPIISSEPLTSYNGQPLYAFNLLNGSSTSYPTRPIYDFELDILRKSNSFIGATFLDTDIVFFRQKPNTYVTYNYNYYNGYVYQLCYNKDFTSASDLALQTFSNPSTFEDGSQIYIFGVIAPGVGENFKFPTWSNAYYLGSIPINKTVTLN